MNTDPAALTELLTEIGACRRCADQLPQGPRPVLRAAVTARLLVVGQAPGSRVHASGIPWDDASGERLRTWLGLDRTRFYDVERVAIVPMGFCYPGRGRTGDRPPRPECRRTWHPRLLPLLPRIELTLAIGRYAQAHFLPDRRSLSLTDTVRAWRQAPPGIMPLPHPSPRNIGWFRSNPWFEQELLPELRQRVAQVLADTPV